MSIDVVDLRNFYVQRLGVVARRVVVLGIRARFADARGMRALGVGSVQQDLSPSGNPQRGVPIPQQLLQGHFVLAFQLERIRLATAHG